MSSGTLFIAVTVITTRGTLLLGSTLFVWGCNATHPRIAFDNTIIRMVKLLFFTLGVRDSNSLRLSCEQPRPPRVQAESVFVQGLLLYPRADLMPAPKSRGPE